MVNVNDKYSQFNIQLTTPIRTNLNFKIMKRLEIYWQRMVQIIQLQQNMDIPCYMLQPQKVRAQYKRNFHDKI